MDEGLLIPWNNSSVCVETSQQQDSVRQTLIFEWIVYLHVDPHEGERGSVALFEEVEGRSLQDMLLIRPLISVINTYYNAVFNKTLCSSKCSRCIVSYLVRRSECVVQTPNHIDIWRWGKNVQDPQNYQHETKTTTIPTDPGRTTKRIVSWNCWFKTHTKTMALSERPFKKYWDFQGLPKCEKLWKNHPEIRSFCAPQRLLVENLLRNPTAKTSPCRCRPFSMLS